MHIDERKRVLFTQFQTLSHSLKIETGRWARINVEEQLCDCVRGIGDQEHVAFMCRCTHVIREKFNIRDGTYENLGDLMVNCDVIQLVDFVDECMRKS